MESGHKQAPKCTNAQPPQGPNMSLRSYGLARQEKRKIPAEDLVETGSFGAKLPHLRNAAIFTHHDQSILLLFYF